MSAPKPQVKPAAQYSTTTGAVGRAPARRSGRQPGWRRGCPALRRTGRSGRGI